MKYYTVNAHQVEELLDVWDEQGTKRFSPEALAADPAAAARVPRGHKYHLWRTIETHEFSFRRRARIAQEEAAAAAAAAAAELEQRRREGGGGQDERVVTANLEAILRSIRESTEVATTSMGNNNQPDQRSAAKSATASIQEAAYLLANQQIQSTFAGTGQTTGVTSTAKVGGESVFATPGAASKEIERAVRKAEEAAASLRGDDDMDGAGIQERRYTCVVCSKSFRLPSSLVTHYNVKHAIVIPPKEAEAATKLNQKSTRSADPVTQNMLVPIGGSLVGNTELEDDLAATTDEMRVLIDGLTRLPNITISGQLDCSVYGEAKEPSTLSDGIPHWRCRLLTSAVDGRAKGLTGVPSVQGRSDAPAPLEGIDVVFYGLSAIGHARQLLQLSGATGGAPTVLIRGLLRYLKVPVESPVHSNRYLPVPVITVAFPAHAVFPLAAPVEKEVSDGSQTAM